MLQSSKMCQTGVVFFAAAAVLSAIFMMPNVVQGGPVHTAKNSSSLLKPLVKVKDELRKDDVEVRDNFNKNLFEGDIILDSPMKLSYEQFEITENALPVHTTAHIWPNKTVFYRISREFSPHERQIIMRAISSIMAVSCVKFVESTNHGPYIDVRKAKGFICAAGIGYTGRVVPMELNFSYCPMMGGVQHEFLHALGFWHEQSRDDRDKYVTILWQNVMDGAKFNFMKGLKAPLHLPYDYESVMHYHPTAFSKNNLPTIVPHMRVARMGQQEYMTEMDIKKLNHIYGCQRNAMPTIPRYSPW